MMFSGLEVTVAGTSGGGGRSHFREPNLTRLRAWGASQRLSTGKVGLVREEDGPSISILLLIVALHQPKPRSRAKGGVA